MLIYHILIDRFAGCDRKREGVCFKGGNLRGILSRLDYIQSLGADGIMLTPFYKTDAYHGYHITDYETVDPHFGTWGDVQQLVEDVHRRGMAIVADFVANHCHEKNSLFVDGRHKDWFMYNNDGSVRGFSDFGFLPMFNTDNHAVRDYLVDKALRLCHIGFDAIRLDHAAGPSYSFWKYFRSSIKTHYPDVKLIGEIWGENDFRPRHRLRYFINRMRYTVQEARQMEYVGVFDGVLDFSYQEMLVKVVNAWNPIIIENKRLARCVKKHFTRYPANFGLWTFLDNHDLNRFLYECHGNTVLFDEAIRFSEQCSHTFLMYYGTEKYFTNQESIFDGTPYADERVRQCME